MAKKLTQAKMMLKKLPAKLVGGLYEVAKDQDKMEVLEQVMQYIKNIDMKSILDNAGAVSTQDTMINNVVDSAFHRGRISSLVLLYTLLKNAEKEVEKRERRK